MGNKSFVFRFSDVEVREREFSLLKAGKVVAVEPSAAFSVLQENTALRKDKVTYLNVRGEYGVLDLYRYAGAGARQTGTGDASYFSVNGGVTNLDSFNNFRIAGTDLGDWAPRAPPSTG